MNKHCRWQDPVIPSQKRILPSAETSFFGLNIYFDDIKNISKTFVCQAFICFNVTKVNITDIVLADKILSSCNLFILIFPAIYAERKTVLNFCSTTLVTFYNVKIDNKYILVLGQVPTQLAFTFSKSTIEAVDKTCEIRSKLTIKTLEWRHGHRSSNFIVNFDYVSYFFLLFLLLTLNKLAIEKISSETRTNPPSKYLFKVRRWNIIVMCWMKWWICSKLTLKTLAKHKLMLRLVSLLLTLNKLRKTFSSLT